MRFPELQTNNENLNNDASVHWLLCASDKSRDRNQTTDCCSIVAKKKGEKGYSLIFEFLHWNLMLLLLPNGHV